MVRANEQHSDEGEESDDQLVVLAAIAAIKGPRVNPPAVKMPLIT